MSDSSSFGMEKCQTFQRGRHRPFDQWIDAYGDRTGLLGGFDMAFLCAKSEREVYETVLEQGSRYRSMAKGYALGSDNSIPDYVPVENYLTMIRAAQEIRKREVK